MKATIVALACAVTLIAALRPAASETVVEGPLASVEARIGYGAALGGRAENMVARTSPLSLNLRGSYLIRQVPRLSLYAGLAAELGDRNSAGASFGATVPIGPIARASAGVVAIVTPFRLAGPSASVGSCVALAVARPCVDLEVTFFALGSDLPKGSMVSQLQVVLAFGFDVL